MPPLTIESAGPLVGGGGIPNPRGAAMKANTNAAPATMEVVVDRSFYFDRQTVKVGSTITLPRVFAMEMIAAKKVHAAPAKVAVAVEQPKVEVKAEAAAKGAAK
jgi:hypothetical protein